MPVYNGERFIKEAVDSILAQTFNNFEFVIIDDGSTDQTSMILDQFVDPRIVRIKHQKSKGVAVSLNEGIRLAHGNFIARMDADDISFPERFQSEIDLLLTNSDIGFISSDFYQINEEGEVLGLCIIPRTHGALSKELLVRNPICHGSTMIRKELFYRAGYYRPFFCVSEDYDLWCRFIEHTKFSCIDSPLYKLRLHSGSVSSRSSNLQRAYRNIHVNFAKERKLRELIHWG